MSLVLLGSGKLANKLRLGCFLGILFHLGLNLVMLCKLAAKGVHVAVAAKLDVYGIVLGDGAIVLGRWCSLCGPSVHGFIRKKCHRKACMLDVASDGGRALTPCMVPECTSLCMVHQLAATAAQISMLIHTLPCCYTRQSTSN